ncbi:glycosyltransferase family 4 protein [bacterium]|nr:glycosyltransferase family 4 protein [bacterium]
MKPNICLISPFGAPLFYDVPGGHGGAEVQFAFLARELARRGATVTFIAGDRGQPADDTIDGVRLLSYKARPTLAGRLSLQRAMWRAKAHIYLQQATGSTTKEVAFFTMWARRRFVYWIASDMDCSAELTRIGNGPPRNKWFVWGLHRADLIVAQHEGQRHLLRENEKLESVVIPNGFPPVPPPTVPREYHLWIGKANSLKRPELLIELARRFPNERFRMICPADVSNPMWMDKVGRELATAPNIERLDRVPFDKMGEELARARTLLITSIIEGFPNTLVQALWQGVPVVSLNVDPGGMIASRGLGVMANDDFEYFSREFGKLIADPKKWSETSARARECAERELSIARMTERFLDAVKGL